MKKISDEKLRSIVGPVHFDEIRSALSEIEPGLSEEKLFREVTDIVSKAFSDEVNGGKLSYERYVDTVKRIYFEL